METTNQTTVAPKTDSVDYAAALRQYSQYGRGRSMRKFCKYARSGQPEMTVKTGGEAPGFIEVKPDGASLNRPLKINELEKWTLTLNEMDRSELRTELIKMVPISLKENDDFRSIVKSNLKRYCKLLQKLDEVCRPDEWDKICSRVQQLCGGINRAVESEYRGARHSAYASIKNQLDGYKTQTNTIPGLMYNTYLVPAETITYRVRKVVAENRRKIKPSDMFHVPLDKRGQVQTQRFSASGYPCLYMSQTVYGCWEEMGRPDFGTLLVSKLVNHQAYNVLDLRVPSATQWNEDMKKCIEFFPLVIASMVQVKNENDTYKPEYLIPQLLTEWVISRNRENRNANQTEIIGIMYTSAQKNSDFDFPDSSYDNYAIPVLKPLGTGKYCQRLTDTFTISSPTYYDLEVLKQGEMIASESFDNEDDIQRKDNLRNSPFGIMEKYIEKQEVVTINIDGKVCVPNVSSK